MRQLNKSLIRFGVVFAVGFVFWPMLRVYSASDSKREPNIQPSDVNSAPAKTKPIVIWFHSYYYSDESLKTALSSGLITHVMLQHMHRADSDWKTNAPVRKAIEVMKKSDAKLIWSRNLWPYYNNENIKLSDFFDPSYYIQEINALRAEAKEMGADFVSLDNEPYGKSIMAYYLKSRRKPTVREREKLKAAVKQAVATVGKIDFTMHAGAIGRPSFAILAQLAQNRICEQTYWFDKERYKKIKYSYEIFGAYVNTTRKRPEKPHAPYFVVSDVFERSHLWSDKKGVFLYTTREKAPALAKELVAYAKRLPEKASVETKGPDSP